MMAKPMKTLELHYLIQISDFFYCFALFTKIYNINSIYRNYIK